MKANYERTTRIGKEDYLVTVAAKMLGLTTYHTNRVLSENNIRFITFAGRCKETRRWSTLDILAYLARQKEAPKC